MFFYYGTWYPKLWLPSFAGSAIAGLPKPLNGHMMYVQQASKRLARETFSVLFSGRTIGIAGQENIFVNKTHRNIVVPDHQAIFQGLKQFHMQKIFQAHAKEIKFHRRFYIIDENMEIIF